MTNVKNQNQYFREWGHCQVLRKEWGVLSHFQDVSSGSLERCVCVFWVEERVEVGAREVTILVTSRMDDKKKSSLKLKDVLFGEESFS